MKGGQSEQNVRIICKVCLPSGANFLATVTHKNINNKKYNTSKLAIFLVLKRRDLRFKVRWR